MGAERYDGRRVVLTSQAVNPFRRWADWYGADNEAVVTFMTMTEQFWNRGTPTA